MKRFKEYLKENPDEFNIKTKDKNIRGEFADGDTHAFGYFMNKLYVSEPEGVHWKIGRKLAAKFVETGNIDKKLIKEIENNILKKKIKFAFDKNILTNILARINKYINGKKDDLLEEKQTIQDLTYLFDDYSRYVLKFPGRIWKNKKILSFWTLPTKTEEILKLKKDLEKNLNIKIDPEEYYIDLDHESTSLSNYTSSGKKKKIKNHDISKAHVQPGMRKALGMTPKGFGTDLQAKIAKKAGFNSYAEYKAFTQQESISIKDYLDILNEEI
jgi:hypothetical protein